MDSVYYLELNIDNVNEFITNTNINYICNIEKIDELINKEELLKLNFKQYIIYNYDSVEYGDLKDVNIDSDNIMEARFFNKNSEFVIRREEDKFVGNIVYDNDDENSYIIDEFLIYDKDNESQYTKLKVKKYIDYDEDGQAYIKYVKPVKLV